LLPELTEVLAALTESHDLLLRKVRQLRVENEARLQGHAPRVLETDRSEAPATVQSPIVHTPYTDDTVHGKGELDRSADVGAVDAGTAHTSGGATPTAPPVDTTTSMDWATPSTATVDGTSVDNPSVETAPPDVGDAGTGPVERVATEAALHDAQPRQNGSHNGDYNFFDELDARLAQINEDEPGTN
jgi:hypothetical protein